MEGAGIALEPYHSGSDYTFVGNYTDGQITITGPGTYYLTETLTTSSSDYAISVESPEVIFDGNGQKITGPGDGYGVYISEKGFHSTITNVSTISEFSRGIYSSADNVTISGSHVSNNTWVGIRSLGNNSTLIGNTVTHNGDYGLHSSGDNSSIIENIAEYNHGGILSQGNFGYVFGNNVICNNRRGISAGGVYVGPEPGDQGHGYYARVENNVVLATNEVGVYSYLPHAIIKDNFVYSTNNIGMSLSYASHNTTLSGNRIGYNNIGIKLSDSAINISLHQNFISNSDISDILVEAGNGKGNGAIFDNYFGSLVSVSGTGNYSRYVWSNPAGPVPGLNLMGAPYIAGNYWSNPTHTGWSDIQPPSKDGYTTIPHEIVPGSGVYDIIPLVRPGEIITSKNDEWTIIHPLGNITVPRYSDATYFAEAKPGAILQNISVDGDLLKPDSSYTFEFVTEDHIIETIGTPAPGQIHVMFTITPETGTYPLVVQFKDGTIGDPTSWYWQFGDGSNSTEQNPSHTYTRPGIYTVSLRAFNEETSGSAVCNDCVEVNS